MRRTLVIIWGALMSSAVTFTALAWFVGRGMRTTMPEVFTWVMLAVAVFNVVLSRVLPRVMTGPEQSKTLLGFALSESAALVSAVAWMVGGDIRSVAGIAVGFASLALQFPREKNEDGETMRVVP